MSKSHLINYEGHNGQPVIATFTLPSHMADSEKLLYPPISQNLQVTCHIVLI